MSEIALDGAAPPGAVEHEAPRAPEQAVAEESEDTRTARERIIDHLQDTAEQGPQTVAQIIAGTMLDRGLVEVTLSRATKAGLIERAAEDVYRLSPPRPKVVPPPPEPSPPPPQPESVEQRTERAQAEAAAAADYALMNALIQACGQNILGDSDEIGAIKMALEVVGLETVLRALGGFAPRLGQVPPRAIVSFRDRRVLETIAFEAMVGMIETAVKKWLSAPIVRIAPAEDARYVRACGCCLA